MVTSRSQTIRCRLGSVTLTGQGLGLGLGTSLFPVGATEIKRLPWQPSRRIAGFRTFLYWLTHGCLLVSFPDVFTIMGFLQMLFT